MPFEFERACKLARRGELVAAQAREVLRDIMKRADIGETLQSATIPAHFDGWLASKRARKSAATGERYGQAVNAFLKTLGKRASLPLTSLTTRDVENFLDARTAEDLSPDTLSLDVKIIGGALNVARRQGLIPINPAEAVELPEAESAERGTFTPAEVAMLVDAPEGGTGKRMFSKRTFHSLRHTSNSEMANNGVSAEVRMGVTGHKSVREHQKYTQLEMDTRRAAVRKIPSLA